MLHTIAIIGAGFSGAATAVQLLRRATQPLRLVLINRSGNMARGLAYGTTSRDHALNVPAGNMSAIADDPDDFLRYCRWADPQTQPGDFAPRRLYGCYLEALLDAADHGAAASVQLERWVGEVARIEPERQHGGAQVHLSDGRVLHADRVVLAFGHFAPTDPPLRKPDFYADPRYIADPWNAPALQAVPADAPVLLIGSGLTAIDVALSLHRQARSAPIWMLSRRGLLSAPHRAQRAPLDAAAGRDLAAALGTTVRGQLRAWRAAVRRHAASGHDWRDLMAALRPHTPALWQAMPQGERRRFLARLQVFWDAARHRCAPQAHAAFIGWLASGAVRPLAGRLRALERDGAGVRVHWSPRGSPDSEQVLEVAAVVNCTGPTMDLTQSRHALVRQMVADGLLQPDPLHLGVMVDAQGALLNAQGQPSEVLCYIGPLLRARDWEATAVPELRMHAAVLATQLLAGLAGGRR